MWNTGRNTVTSKFHPETATGQSQLQRSHSLGRADTLDMLESHRQHRQQFLRNRSLFERPTVVSHQQLKLPPEVKSVSLGDKDISRSGIGASSQECDGVVPDININLPALEIVEDASTETHTRVVNEVETPTINTSTSASTEKGKLAESSTLVYDQLNFGPSSKLSRHNSMEASTSERYISKWDRPTKTVKDIKEGYLTTKSGNGYNRTFLSRRSSMSSIPVKQLANKFSN